MKSVSLRSCAIIGTAMTAGLALLSTVSAEWYGPDDVEPYLDTHACRVLYVDEFGHGVQPEIQDPNGYTIGVPYYGFDCLPIPEPTIDAPDSFDGFPTISGVSPGIPVGGNFTVDVIDALFNTQTMNLVMQSSTGAYSFIPHQRLPEGRYTASTSYFYSPPFPPLTPLPPGAYLSYHPGGYMPPVELHATDSGSVDYSPRITVEVDPTVSQDGLPAIRGRVWNVPVNSDVTLTIFPNGVTTPQQTLVTPSTAMDTYETVPTMPIPPGTYRVHAEVTDAQGDRATAETNGRVVSPGSGSTNPPGTGGTSPGTGSVTPPELPSAPSGGPGGPSTPTPEEPLIPIFHLCDAPVKNLTDTKLDPFYGKLQVIDRSNINRFVTRAEFLKLLFHAVGRDASAEQEFPYYDVDESHTLGRYVSLAARIGLVDRTQMFFRPDAVLSRAEASKILIQAGALPLTPYNATFDDVLLSHPMAGQIQTAYDRCILHGRHTVDGISILPNGVRLFEPHDGITLGEVMKVLYNLTHQSEE